MYEIYFLLNCRYHDFFNLAFSRLDIARNKIEDEESGLYNKYITSSKRKQFFKVAYHTHAKYSDIAWIFIFSNKYILKNLTIPRSVYRVVNTKHGFYSFYKNTSFNETTNQFKNSVLSFYKFLFLGIRL